MRWKKVVSVFSVAVVLAVMTVSASAQKGNKGRLQDPYELAGQELAGQGMRTATPWGTLIQYDHPLPEIDAATSANWELHNLDVAGSRYFPLDQISTSSVKSLAPSWLASVNLSTGRGLHMTPLVVNGIMYITSQAGRTVEALDATTGEAIWSFQVADNVIPGDQLGSQHRGVAFGDGTIYMLAGGSVLAFDAKVGTPIPSFGTKGKSDVMFDILKARYPDIKTTNDKGNYFTAAPQYYKGMVIAVSGFSERTPPGAWLMGIDAKTGKLIWKFNTIPQDPSDEGWAIAKDTWSGPQRTGGGIWETPSIDSSLGMLYLQTANPFPFVDGSWRAGTNLFTSSIVALDVTTGKIKWYFQQTHHDLWDFDSASPPIIFDMKVNGKTVKAVAESSKSGLLYVLNRETGKPIFPIVETPVPTATTRPGEKPWPTQPIPYASDGRTVLAVVPIIPTDVPDNLAQYIVPPFTPPLTSTPQIRAPGTLGGTNFGPISFSLHTGLLYTTGVHTAFTAGFTPSPTLPAKGYVSAFDANNLGLVWQRVLPGIVQGGTVVTSGDLLFVGDTTGFFYALDARTGDVLWKFNTGASIAASPMVYMVNGKEYVSIAAGGGRNGRVGNVIVTFALPGQ